MRSAGAKSSCSASTTNPERAQQSHPVAVRRVELHPAPGPLHAVGLRVPPQQPLPRHPLVGRDAQRRQVAVGEEHQASTGAQQPGDLRKPALGVAPRRGAVLAHHEVDTAVGQRQLLAVALHEREHRAEPALQPAGRGQLLAGEVDRHGPGPLAREPRRDVGRAAGQLEHVEPAHVSQDAELALGDGEQAPHGIRPGPQLVGGGIGEALVDHGPQGPVQGHLVGA